MASWLSTLKIIPWADVIDAAPVLVKGARQLLRKAGRQESPAASAADPQTRLGLVEAELADATRLIESLAEQHQQLVVALDRLRARQLTLQRWLAIAGLMGVALTVAVAWLALR